MLWMHMKTRLLLSILLISLLSACGSDSENIPELTNSDEKTFYNDEEHSAQLLTINSRVFGSLTSGSDNTDVFRLNIVKGGSLTVTLSAASKTDFDIAILAENFDPTILTEYNETGDGLLAYSYGDDSREKASYTIKNPGLYYVAVSAFSGSSEYTLSVYGSAQSKIIPVNDNSQFYYTFYPIPGVEAPPLCIQYNETAYQASTPEVTNGLTPGECSSTEIEFAGACPAQYEEILIFYTAGLEPVCNHI